jgi:hypothetical protein
MNRNISPGGKPMRPPGQASQSGLLSALCKMASVSRSMLREIFDESAYERFLERSRLPSSPKAYAMFQRENEQARSRRPRCC